MRGLVKKNTLQGIADTIRMSGVDRKFKPSEIAKGVEDVYNNGLAIGNTMGYQQGQAEGYLQGKTEGKNEGYSEGYDQGHANGYESGKQDGYEDGYKDGKNSYVDGNEVAY